MTAYVRNMSLGCAFATALLMCGLSEASAAFFKLEAGEQYAQDLPAQTFQQIPAPYDELMAVADTEVGRQVSFKCMACHMFKANAPNLQGPNLFGVVGRDVASYPGYRFSTGPGSLSELEGNWTVERLDHFIQSPKQFAPATKSTFRGLSRLPDRINLIAYMRTLISNPTTDDRPPNGSPG
ncbi:MAG: hypothetical protein QM773_02810 [Hyphomonadaceae bacterium]